MNINVCKTKIHFDKTFIYNIFKVYNFILQKCIIQKKKFLENMNVRNVKFINTICINVKKIK